MRITLEKSNRNKSAIKEKPPKEYKIEVVHGKHGTLVLIKR